MERTAATEILVRVVTPEPNLLAVAFDGDQSESELERGLADGVTVLVTRTERALGPGQPEVIDLLLRVTDTVASTGVSVAAGVLSAFLYDWLKNRRARVRIDETPLTKITHEEITVSLTRILETKSAKVDTD